MGEWLGFLKETNTKSLKAWRASKIINVDFPQHKSFMRHHLLPGSLGPWSFLQETLMRASFYRCNQVAYHKHQLPSTHPRRAERINKCKNRGICKHKKIIIFLLHYKIHRCILRKKTIRFFKKSPSTEKKKRPLRIGLRFIWCYFEMKEWNKLNFEVLTLLAISTTYFMRELVKDLSSTAKGCTFIVVIFHYAYGKEINETEIMYT